LYAVETCRAEPDSNLESGVPDLLLRASSASRARPNYCCVAEHTYERAAMILDSDGGRLVQVSQSLTVLGHRPLYADDLEDLVVIAHERPAQVGALLLPAECAGDCWPAVRKRLIDPLGLSPSSVLVVGERLSFSDAYALHSDGLRWALREPFTPWELRFAVSLVLSVSDSNEPRLEMRVPCSIPVEIETDHRALSVQLTDLSTSGAFVELAHPLPDGMLVTVRGTLGGRPASLRARVAWRSCPDSPSWRDRGMGIEFDRVDRATHDLLRQQMVRAIDRFRLRTLITPERRP
jgi:hypothetical protein